MPSKCSQVRAIPSGGAANSVRYHHAERYGLSSGIGWRANTAPIGYDVPGTDRRFIAVYGFLNCPASTRAPTTVVGTVTGYQLPVSTPAWDRAGPSASTFADD